MRVIGIYAQDQWTMDRLTVNAGLRFDYFRGGYPDHTLPQTTWGPGAFFEGQDVAIWKDLNPRLGLVYDLRGDGRTALKVTASRYVDGRDHARGHHQPGAAERRQRVSHVARRGPRPLHPSRSVRSRRRHRAG